LIERLYTNVRVDFTDVYDLLYFIYLLEI